MALDFHGFINNHLANVFAGRASQISALGHRVPSSYAPTHRPPETIRGRLVNWTTHFFHSSPSQPIDTTRGNILP